MKLYTHLNFGGNCEEAFRYYEKHLGGRITTIMRARDLPPGVKAPPGSPDAVIHAAMDIAGVELIGNDVPPTVFARAELHRRWSAVCWIHVRKHARVPRVPTHYAALPRGR